ncbi:tyrosine-type recombinase/integrase [Nonomuraea sp. NPDC049750]|uniref:tyrosine-type recombinase/integrase n=1 Tax=Nonomuraea sp. NPDC049750 TaxID=3154738 RepID=UPI0033EE6961
MRIRATLVLLATGLRWGELTALRVCDVDFDAGTLTVAQVVREDENRRPYIESTEGKSANAFRTITLPPKALKVLRRRAQGKGKPALLFPTPGTRGGTLWRNANFQRTPLAEGEGVRGAAWPDQGADPARAAPQPRKRAHPRGGDRARF